MDSSRSLQEVVSNVGIGIVSTTHIEFPIRIAERCYGLRKPNLLEFLEPRRFSTGEFCPKYIVNDKMGLRGKHVYLIVTPGPYKSSEELMERLKMSAFAAKEHRADKVIAILTDFPHARQDRGPDEDEKALGEPTTVRYHARQLESAGIDRVITTHAHSTRIAAYFALEYGLIPTEMFPEEARKSRIRDIIVPDHIDVNNPQIQELGREVFKSISPHAILADYLLHQSSIVGSDYLRNGGEGIVLRAVDKGNKEFIDQLKEALFLPNASVIYCNKIRGKKNDPTSVKIEVIGTSDNFTTLNDKLEILADDGSDTSGTLIQNGALADKGIIFNEREYGTPKERIVHFTHPWLGGEAHQSVQGRLVRELRVREIVTANTRPYIDDSQHHDFKTISTVLRLAGLYADGIIANEMGHDVSKRYTGFESKEQQQQFLAHTYGLKRHSRHFMFTEPEAVRKGIFFPLRS
jgi:phosphoribosylpyrophosphate synthetase